MLANMESVAAESINKSMGFDRNVDSYVHDARLRSWTPHGHVQIVGLLRMWDVHEMVSKFGSIRARKAGDEIGAVLLAVVAIALHATEPNVWSVIS